MPLASQVPESRAGLTTEDYYYSSYLYNNNDIKRIFASEWWLIWLLFISPHFHSDPIFLFSTVPFVTSIRIPCILSWTPSLPLIQLQTTLHANSANFFEEGAVARSFKSDTLHFRDCGEWATNWERHYSKIQSPAKTATKKTLRCSCWCWFQQLVVQCFDTNSQLKTITVQVMA